MTTRQRWRWVVAWSLFLCGPIFALVMHFWGVMTDCKPHDVDGQCGMSTFFGNVEGIVGGCIFSLAGLAGLLMLKRKQAIRRIDLRQQSGVPSDISDERR